MCGDWGKIFLWKEPYSDSHHIFSAPWEKLIGLLTEIGPVSDLCKSTRPVPHLVGKQDTLSSSACPNLSFLKASYTPTLVMKTCLIFPCLQRFPLCIPAVFDTSWLDVLPLVGFEPSTVSAETSTWNVCFPFCLTEISTHLQWMKSGEEGAVLTGLWFPFDVLHSRSHDKVVGTGETSSSFWPGEQFGWQGVLCCRGQLIGKVDLERPFTEWICFARLRELNVYTASG